MYVKIAALPQPVQDALASVQYSKGDIEVIPTSEASLADAGSAGRRAFVTMVNLTSGQSETTWGSWGGPNMFNRSNAVDLDTATYPMPEQGVVIRGSHGHGGVWARIYVHPGMLGRELPAAAETVSQADLDALYCHGRIKGGQYRRDEMQRRNVSVETVASLVERGLLKSNRAGATQITTEGKNALGEYRGYPQS